MTLLTKHLLVLMVQRNVKILALWCRFGWSGFRCCSCYRLITTHSDLEKHAELDISCALIHFLLASYNRVFPAFW